MVGPWSGALNWTAIAGLFKGSRGRGGGIVAASAISIAMANSRSLLLPLLIVAAALAGCDQIAVLDGTKAREADGVAIGSACRQAGRAIEDCFTMNPEASKASVFAGWKEMNDYMVANKLETVNPQIARAEPAKAEAAKEEAPKESAPKAESHGAPPIVIPPVVAPPAPPAPSAAAVPPVALPGAPPAPGSIALGGQSIPLIVPKTPPSLAPAPPAAAAAHGHD
jgi:hypothetical protein